VSALQVTSPAHSKISRTMHQGSRDLRKVPKGRVQGAQLEAKDALTEKPDNILSACSLDKASLRAMALNSVIGLITQSFNRKKNHEWRACFATFDQLKFCSNQVSDATPVANVDVSDDEGSA
jgi:hypothetical protein